MIIITINELASFIAKNNAEEQSAIQGYYLLISYVKNASDVDDITLRELIADIEEIISDEMNHTLKLSNWLTSLTEVYPNED